MCACWQLFGRSLGALVIVEQNRRESPTHVPFKMAGEHAQQHVSADPVGQAVMDRSELEIDGFDQAEGEFGLG